MRIDLISSQTFFLILLWFWVGTSVTAHAPFFTSYKKIVVLLLCSLQATLKCRAQNVKTRVRSTDGGLRQPWSAHLAHSPWSNNGQLYYSRHHANHTHFQVSQSRMISTEFQFLLYRWGVWDPNRKQWGPHRDQGGITAKWPVWNLWPFLPP